MTSEAELDLAELDDASPRTFLLAILSAFDIDVPVQLLIRAALLFDIDENRTRVALHRLRTKGFVTSNERGTYRRAYDVALLDETTHWRNVLSRLVPWNQRWVAVHTAPLPRADKTVARRRDRATTVVGLRELAPGLLIRPDNLSGGVSGLRQRLNRLGLEPEALVFSLDELGPHDDVARGLWESLSLDARYRSHLDRLEEVAQRMDELGDEEAARQSFIVGNRAIRDIVTDPLLPDPLVDSELRRTFIARMGTFDDLGRQVWARALGSELTLRRAPVAVR